MEAILKVCFGGIVRVALPVLAAVFFWNIVAQYIMEKSCLRRLAQAVKQVR